jgi:hypothetical protein
MTEDLEQFYTTLQEIDQWLDLAIEKSRDLQSSKDNIHNQYNGFKVTLIFSICNGEEAEIMYLAIKCIVTKKKIYIY